MHYTYARENKTRICYDATTVNRCSLEKVASENISKVEDNLKKIISEQVAKNQENVESQIEKVVTQHLTYAELV